MKEDINKIIEKDGRKLTTLEMLRCYKSGIISEMQIEDYFTHLRNKTLDEAIELAENMFGEDIPKDNQMEGFEKYHTTLSNGKYLEKCWECPNHQNIERFLTALQQSKANILSLKE